jgi:putative mRNA 3-end processing factor
LIEDNLISVSCSSQSKNGPIKLDRIYCDGYVEDNSNGIGVFSHFHSDHIGDVEACLRKYDTLITHPITLAAIDALNPGYKLYASWASQDYGQYFPSPVGKIRLLKANHIPGSCQVHLETNDSTFLYSGDFKFPEMTIKQADYLVLDASHGDPNYDGPTDRLSVKNRMLDDIHEKMDLGKPVVIISHSGTMQELIHHFEINDSQKPLNHDIPFVARKEQIQILNRIYENEKDEFRNIIEYDSPDYWKLIRNNSRCIIFLSNIPKRNDENDSFLDSIDEDIQNYYKIIVDRFKFEKNKPAIQPFPGNYEGMGCRYNLASHSSIAEILDYVDAVSPKEIITDASRSNFAPILSKLISLKFPKIKVHAEPRV